MVEAGRAHTYFSYWESRLHSGTSETHIREVLQHASTEIYLAAAWGRSAQPKPVGKLFGTFGKASSPWLLAMSLRPLLFISQVDGYFYRRYSSICLDWNLDLSHTGEFQDGRLLPKLLLQRAQLA